MSLCLETEPWLLPGASVGCNWALFIIHGQAGCIQSLDLFSKLLFLLELAVAVLLITSTLDDAAAHTC